MRCLAGLTLAAALVAQAGPIQRIADINRTLLPSTGASLWSTGQAGNTPVFTGCTDEECDPWTTDGTQAGTHRIANVAPGLSSGAWYTPFGGQLYFFASVSASGWRQLWRTDGTAAGTQVAVPSLLAQDGVQPAATTNAIFFAGGDGTLWRTDGTQAGTFKLSSAPAVHQLTAAGDRVFFISGAYSDARTLWVSDGTVAGTVSIMGLGASDRPVVGSTGRAYFFAPNATGGLGLWVSDGTSAGTAIVDGTPASLSGLAEMNGMAYFTTWETSSTTDPFTRLWRSDGTAAGTVPLMTHAQSLGASRIVHAGNHVMYVLSGFSGDSLWSSDGASASQQLDSGFTFNLPLLVAASRIYYGAIQYGGVRALHWSDGVTSGNVPGSDFLSSDVLGTLGQRALVKLRGRYDFLALADETGIAPLLSAPGEPASDSYCRKGHAVVGDTVFFAADDGLHGCELWKSDGTEAGTVLVADRTPGYGRHSIPPDGLSYWTPDPQFVAAGGRVFYNASDGTGNFQVYSSDGTDAGTTVVTSIGQYPGNPPRLILGAYGSYAYVSVSAESAQQSGLYRTDGTAQGTVRIAGLIPQSFRSSADGLYFVDQTGALAWTDGTSVSVFDSGAHFPPMAVVGSRLFYIRWDRPDYVLRVVDGRAGTSADIVRYPQLSQYNPPDDGLFVGASADGAVLFVGPVGSLWRSDGTAAGTVQISVAAPIGGLLQEDSSAPPVPGVSFFATAAALYRTDGTSHGTYAVSEGAARATAFGRTVAARGTRFFTAVDAAGRELWMSGGTAAGTVRIQDFAAGAANIPPTEFAGEELEIAVTPRGLFFFTGGGGYKMHPYSLAFDDVPDAFSIARRTKAPLAATVISLPVQITGINVATPVSASGGEFCVSSSNDCSCDLQPFAASGSVNLGQYVCVRQTSASTPSTATDTVVAVNGVQATFTSVTLAQFPVTVTRTGTGAGRVVSSPAVIDCGAACIAQILEDTTVTFDAARSPGSVFTGWSGACSGLGSCAITVTGPVDLMAGFAQVSSTLARRDANGDGTSDLLWRNGDLYGLWFMNGTTQLSHGPVSDVPGAVVVLTGDFDGDGRMDILWREPNGGYVMALMDSRRVISSARVRAGSEGWELHGSGDFNGDGRLDLLWRNANGAIEMWLMDGTSAMSVAQLQPPGSAWTVAMTGDFNGDGWDDLAWTRADGTVSLWLLRGMALLAHGQIMPPGTGWHLTHSGDFDGDGRSDLVWTHDNGSVGLWLMNGLAQVARKSLMGAGTAWHVIGVADLDGNGKSDLLWAATDGSVSAWLMDGLNIASRGPLMGPNTGWSVALTGDFNGDGRADLVWRHQSGSVGLWLMSGLTVLSHLTQMPAGSVWIPVP